MTTFTCTYPELRKVAGDFIKAIPGAGLDELDAGMKCVQLHFLGMEPTAGHEVAGAAALMRIVTREYLAAEVQLEA